MMGIGIRLVGVMALLALASGANAQAAGERIAGDVASADASALTIKGQSGAVAQVKLSPNVRVSVRAPISLAQLQPGMYVAITSVPQPDGTLLASELRVFPESQRGTGEGHRPMSAGKVYLGDSGLQRK